MAIERRQFDEASAELRQALRLRPRNLQAADNLSLALRQLRRLDEATRCQRLADELRHRSAPASTGRGPLPRYAI
jgi:Flp pilus assembly protein TadD